MQNDELKEIRLIYYQPLYIYTRTRQGNQRETHFKDSTLWTPQRSYERERERKKIIDDA